MSKHSKKSSNAVKQRQIRLPMSLYRDPTANSLAGHFRLPYQVTISSDGVNRINTVYNNTSVSSYGDWSSLAAIYDEYRILAIDLSVACTAPNTSNLSNWIAVCYDNDDATALTTVAQVMEYDNHIIFPAIWSSGEKRSKFFYIPNSPSSPISWYDIAAVSQVGSVKFYGDSLTASVPYLNITLNYYVEFRGRR